MGVEDRDWNRQPTATPNSTSTHRTATTLVAVIVFAAVAVFLLTHVSLGSGSKTVGGVPGLEGPRLGGAPVYSHDDPWLAWLAPEEVCPGGEQVAAPAEISTMLCLINYARQHQGLVPVALTPILDTASGAKAQDIVRCGRFEHAACGKYPQQVATDAGYAGSFGENLYAAEGRLTAPRVALDRWLNSPGHRENLFRPQWRTAGVAALHGATFDRFHDGVVWVSQFGDR